MNLLSLDDVLLKIIEKFEKAGGLTGLVYGGLFLVAAYLISKFGETDGLTGMIFSGLILLVAYLVKQQVDFSDKLIDMVNRNDERLHDLKKTLYDAEVLPDRRGKKKLSIVPDDNRRND
jgi:uncharacterized membrane protein (UPF0136 family)